MRQLEEALTLLADRAEPLSVDVLITRIETELGMAPPAVAEPREPSMVTHETIQRKPPTHEPRPRWWRRPVAAFGAALVALLIGAGIAWAVGVFDGDQPAVADRSELEAVIAMTDAFNAYDAAGYAAFWAEGATGREDIVIRGPEWNELVADEEESRAHIELSNCTQTDRDVTCTITRSDRYQTETAGAVLTWDSTYHFTEDGLISGVTFDDSTVYDEIDAYFAALGAWLEATHPDVYPTFFVEGFGTVKEYYYTLEGLAEIEPYLGEFFAQSEVYPLDR